MPYGYGASKDYSPKSSGGNGEGQARDRHPPAPRPAPRPYKDPDPISEVVPGDKTFEPAVKQLLNIGPSLHGDMKEPKKTIQQLIAEQQEEKYGPLADPTKLGETIDKRTEKEKEEDWEKAQDWDLIQDMANKGYDFDEIQKAVEKGLTQKAPTTDRRQSLIDFGLRSIMPETGLEKSLLSRLKSFVPGTQTGISSLTDRMGSLGKYFNPQKMITSFALNKMGLGFLNPILGIASLMGFNPFKNLGTKYAGVPRKEQPTIGGRGGDATENVVQASIKKFQPTQSQQDQMAEIMRKRMILQGYADKGALNERGMNTLTQMNQLINQYQVNPRSIWT
tara:strand:- start:47 stop:1051 length:1005 start_codon:yes stop_codon:yes gene_type:complete